MINFNLNVNIYFQNLETYKKYVYFNWFNSATFLCLSSDRIYISNFIWHYLFSVQLMEAVVCFVDISRMVDHHSLHFLLIIILNYIMQRHNCFKGCNWAVSLTTSKINWFFDSRYTYPHRMYISIWGFPFCHF